MDKFLVILACACAAAHAQYQGFGQNTGVSRGNTKHTSSFGPSSFGQNSFGQNSGFGQSSFGQSTTSKPYSFGQNSFGQSSGFGQSSTAKPNAFGQNSAFGQSAFNSRGQSQSSFQTPRPIASQQQTQYQQAAPKLSAGTCHEKNERYPVSGSCDRYIECINGTAEEKLCPDGLRFNPNVNFNVYPCQYPADVPCLERSSLQPAQATEDCPHQFGYYKLGDARNCSGFRNCVNGMAYDFTCPEGLAFNSATYRCEWPDEVEDCDAEAFLGFRCPEVPISKELGPPAGYRYYRSDNNCQKYFICIENRPRALSCGGDSAFDELTSSCVSADEVAACPAELKAAAVRSRDDEKQRLAKELKLQARTPEQRRRF